MCSVFGIFCCHELDCGLPDLKQAMYVTAGSIFVKRGSECRSDTSDKKKRAGKGSAHALIPS
jgi:hypothetical protein